MTMCNCTATACTIDPNVGTNFDMHVVSAAQMSGSATIGSTHNVYVDRAE
jgi:hypothetical protein